MFVSSLCTLLLAPICFWHLQIVNTVLFAFVVELCGLIFLNKILKIFFEKWEPNKKKYDTQMF